MTEADMPDPILDPADDGEYELSVEAGESARDDMNASDEEFDVEIPGDDEEFAVEIPADDLDAAFAMAGEAEAEAEPSEDAEADAGTALSDAEGDAEVAAEADAAEGAEFAADSGHDAETAVEADADDESESPRAPLTFTPDADAVAEQTRMVEALLFAAAEPLDEATLAARLPAGADVPALIAGLQAQMQGRGVELVQVAGGWRLQTPADLAWLLEEVREERRKLSAAARETLAIIAYHQPVTRAEIEDVRGVAVSKGTVDMLMELGWVRMRGRRRAPGRPVTYGTTDLFLAHFGLESLSDLPGKAELKAAGLLDTRLPADFVVPEPGVLNTADEDPLEEEALENAAFHVDFLGDSGEDAAPEDVQAQAKTA